MKKCSKCKLVKSLASYGKRVCEKDGLHYYCKGCIRTINHSESGKAAEKKYAKSNKRKSYIEAYNGNTANRARKKQLQTTPEFRAWRRNYENERLRTDLNFKLTKAIRTRLFMAIRIKQKKGSAILNLGCSIDELIAHIEAQFISDMSWANWGIKEGQWSIDHIEALSSVDLENETEFKRVNHYTNLRPMWHIDNVKKGNKKGKLFRLPSST